MISNVLSSERLRLSRVRTFVSCPEGTQAAVNVWPALFLRDESPVKHLAEEGDFSL